MLACSPRPETGAAPAGPRYAAAAAAPSPVYRLAVHPLHNPRKLSQAFQPLVDHLNAQMPGVRFELEASRDYAVYEARIRAREPDLLLPNPWQTLQAMRVGYTVIAMAGDADDFKGLLIVRKDNPITSPLDLKGQAVAYPAPTALAACVMPQWFLHRSGLNVVRDLDNRYVGSQESSILNVLSGQVAAAATWPPPWRAFQKEHPAEAAQLKVMWQTPPLLNNAVMVRDDLPLAVRDRVRELLLSLHDTAPGRAVLEAMETSRMHAADDGRYALVRDFVSRFEREVRPVESR